MKIYSKSLLGLFLFLFLISLSPSNVLAGGDDGLGLLPSSEKVDVDFKITSGLDINKEKESTFDKKRTISGTANEGTIITIDIHNQATQKDEEEIQSTENKTDETESTENKTKDDECYTIEVGASCIFSQTVELAIGENKIDITVEEKGKDTIEKVFKINRKSREIKQELEKAIVLPGETETKLIEEESSNALDQLLKSNVER